MIVRDEVRDRIEGRASDAEIDAAIVAAATAQGHPAIDGNLELREADDDDPVWDVIDAAIASLSPRIAVIFTDTVVLDGAMFDPGSIARFIVENASDDLRAEVWLVADPYDSDTADLLEWRKSLGIKLAPMGAARMAGRNQRHGLITWLASTRPFERIVVADPTYRSDDPRVTIHRRVTR